MAEHAAKNCCSDHDDCHLPGELICCEDCPDLERCACGHGWHLHDPEAVPPICLPCGDAKTCADRGDIDFPAGDDRAAGGGGR